MAWVAYDKHKLGQYGSNPINFGASGDTIKLMIVTSSYTPDQTNDEFITAANANEVSGTNYTAGGVTLASKTLTVTGHVLTFGCATITIAQSAGGFSNGRIACLYKDSGSPTTSRLIAYYDFGGNKGNVAGDLQLIDASGIFAV